MKIFLIAFCKIRNILLIHIVSFTFFFFSRIFLSVFDYFLLKLVFIHYYIFLIEKQMDSDVTNIVFFKDFLSCLFHHCYFRSNNNYKYLCLCTTVHNQIIICLINIRDYLVMKRSFRKICMMNKDIIKVISNVFLLNKFL